MVRGTGAFDAAHQLIAEFRLHDAGTPVDVSPLEAVYPPIEADLWESSLAGFALPAMEPNPASGIRGYVVMGTHVAEVSRDVLYAHEVGHLLCGHGGSYKALTVNPWFDDRQEREAWQLAAQLLIPRSVLWEAYSDEWTAEHIAAACDVPEWLVDRYPKW